MYVDSLKQRIMVIHLSSYFTEKGKVNEKSISKVLIVHCIELLHLYTVILDIFVIESYPDFHVLK